MTHGLFARTVRNLPRVEKYWVSLSLHYHPEHAWAKVEREGVRVGLDDFAQQNMGRILAFRLRGKGVELEQSKAFGTLESGKWVQRLISPVSGTIMEINQKAVRSPRIINEDPYGEGWLIIIKPTSKLDEELGKLFIGDAAINWLREEIKRWEKEKK